MTNVESKQFKSILEAQEAELTGSLRSRDGIIIEKASDTLDEVQLAGERELAIRNLDRDSKMCDISAGLSPVSHRFLRRLPALR